jgi:hypothetical protein
LPVPPFLITAQGKRRKRDDAAISFSHWILALIVLSFIDNAVGPSLTGGENGCPEKTVRFMKF